LNYPNDKVIRILLVDDDPDDQVMLVDLLAQVRVQKYGVDWASSYSIGLEKLLSFTSYDACFLDFQLGSHTGIDLLREAVSQGCKIPIIMLTGYGEPEVDLEAMREGAADYLVKDEVSPLLLERTIRYAIHRAKSRQEIFDREAQIVMQERLASVGLLASSLAHEIGTPLGVIRGRAEYLEMKLRDNAEAVKTSTVIISQIDRVSKLIRSLLNLARGEIRKPVEPVGVNEVFAELTDLMGHDLRTCEVVVSSAVPDDLRVKAEPGPLHQVLLNLLVNSLHAIQTATLTGRRDHFIRLRAEDRGAFWGILLEDSGCGISPVNLKKLFLPFFTTKDIGSGTGLGLATSYRIVESWGGRIDVHSEEGRGSSFTLVLPKA
jgi:two-component system sensor histidine kinase/response regulator